MIDVSLKLGADHAFFCNFLPSPYNGFRFEERVLAADGNIARQLRAMLGSYSAPVRKKVTFPKLPESSINRNHCNTYFSQIRFDGDGNVSSCSIMLLNMEGHGNYRDKNVWNSEFFRTMRKTFLSNDNERLPSPCRLCPENKGVKIGVK
jgi:hypothetical protein